MAEKNVKKRNWAFVLYPESAPADWLELLRLGGLMGAVSPLHDKDKNDDGTPKKPHHHVIVIYDGPTTYSNVKGLTDRLNQPHPQPLEQVRGYYRYLTHADNPEKAQYDPADIQLINGFDIRDFVELTKTEVAKIIRDVVEFIRLNKIVEYADLMEILQDGGEATKDWFDVAASHTLFFTGYLQSRRYRSGGE